MSQSQITLYAYPTSPYAAKLACVLDYKGLDFKVVNVDPISRKELGFSAQKVLPVLKIDEEWKLDSTPIALWVEQLFPHHSILGVGNKQRKAILKMDAWVSNTLYPMLFRSFMDWDKFFTWVGDRYKYANLTHKTKPLPSYALALWPLLIKSVPFIKRHASALDLNEPIRAQRLRIYDELEQLVDGDAAAPFMGGLGEASLADLAAYPAMAVPYYCGLKDSVELEDYPNIRRWFSAMDERLSARALIVDPANFSRKPPLIKEVKKR